MLEVFSHANTSLWSQVFCYCKVSVLISRALMCNNSSQNLYCLFIAINCGIQWIFSEKRNCNWITCLSRQLFMKALSLKLFVQSLNYMSIYYCMSCYYMLLYCMSIICNWSIQLNYTLWKLLWKHSQKLFVYCYTKQCN